MPPRSTSTRGGAASARGRPLAGAASPRVRPAGQGHLQVALPSSVSAVGVKRPGYGTLGRPIHAFVNTCPVTIPDKEIYQYDVKILSDDGKEKALPNRLNRKLFARLSVMHPNDVRRGAVAYDGQKIAYACYQLDLGQSLERVFRIEYVEANVENARGREYQIRLTAAMDADGRVKKINPEVLRRFVEGKQSNDTSVSEAVAALNVVLRMKPFEEHPFHGRSFYTALGKGALGFGLEVWQGYLQSLRPASGRLLINLDITAGVMYKEGTLAGLCIEYLNDRGIQRLNHLSPGHPGFTEYHRRKLVRFIIGMRIIPTIGASGPKMRKGKPVGVAALSREGASQIMFNPNGGGALNVADYFRLQNQPLASPHTICIRTPSGAYYPLERCEVVPGQLVKKEIPPDAVAKVVEFATKKPGDRFNAIKNATHVFGYGVSDYVREFGLNVNTDGLPMSIAGRVLSVPKLQYGKQKGTDHEVVRRPLSVITSIIDPSKTPVRGSWNMVDKKLFKPSVIRGWILLILVPQLKDDVVQGIANGFIDGCESVGLEFGKDPRERRPLIKHAVAENAAAELAAAGRMFRDALKGRLPHLVVAVLPEANNAPIYAAVKHFGICTAGVATQCLRVRKCTGAKRQYWANVALKVNVKLGGINVVPSPDVGQGVITDPAMPTIVLGADVTHPPPGSNSPSYAALVSSVDSNAAKYITSDSIQESRREMIAGLEGMTQDALTAFSDYREKVERVPPRDAKPKRLIYYRDGVSEGEYQKVLDIELPMIRAACQKANVSPKITVIVVVKRHHIRFKDDANNNLPAGTVFDRDITSPIEFDWYLQSHAPLLGTSRSGHYSVLHDDNNFGADAIQKLSYTLCYTYARTTRSVSIPTPVYYAHLVCDKAKLHYKPSDAMALSDAGTDSTTDVKQRYISSYQGLHASMKNYMWWM
ncbi:argonaute-like protein [Hymenopellis radicata]|nr:argonaute-like protein [Hymenopellis radicata]